LFDIVGKRAETLLDVMDHIERFTLERAWTDLTDREFFWEPTSPTWSVRRREDCRTPTPFGEGSWVADFEFPEPTPIPLTSVGWLAWHIGSVPGRLVEIDFFDGDRTMASGWTSPYLTHHPVFITAADAMATLRHGWAALRSAIAITTDEAFETLTPQYTYARAPMRDGVCALGQPGPQHPAASFVAGALNEVSHHGTQICVLRDLFGATASQ
jgi:hypothetical protein